MTSRVVRWALAAALVAAVAGPALAQKPDLVPSTSFAFLSIHVAEVWDTPSMKPVREALLKGDHPLVPPIVGTLGVPPETIEHLTAFWPNVPLGPGENRPFVVLTTRKPFNEAKLLKTLGAATSADMLRPRGQQDFRGEAISPLPPTTVEPKKDAPEPVAQRRVAPAEKAEPAGEMPELYFLPNSPFEALFLIDERTILFLPTNSFFARGDVRSGVYSLLGQLLRKKADGPLAEALKLSEKHAVVAGVRVSMLLPVIERELLTRELTPFKSLFRAKTMLVTLDVGAAAKVGIKLHYADEAHARRAEPVFKTLLQTASEYLAGSRKDLALHTDLATVIEPLLELAIQSLDKAEVKADGTTVVAQVEAEIGPTIAKAIAAAPAAMLATADRVNALNNLKQIGLAIHSYHDTNGHLPNDILDPATGKAILSWRVAILPEIEQGKLYCQIDLKLPWDNPANKKFLDKMPDVYRVYGRETKDKGTTYLQMPSAEKALDGGSPFKVNGRKIGMTSITDGTSNTLMVVEAADAVSWMKPDDVVFDPKNLPKLGAPGRDKFFALFGDGSVREFRRSKLTDDTLRGLLTINGGEVLNLDEK